jgi:hypothetical protein
MFFVLIFLILAALASYLFPAWSWAAVLAVSFGCVAALRLLLFLLDRSDSKAQKHS